MEPGDAENDNEADGSASALRAQIAELEIRLREEKSRFDLLQLEACHEVEKHVRDCSGLRESLARLEEDCRILRERERRDRDTIMGLLEEIDRKERLFKEKFVDLEDEITVLECAELRAEDEALEWKKKYLEQVKAVGNANEDAVKVDDEMPKRDLRAPIGEPAGFDGIGDKMKPPRKKLFPRQVWIKREDISVETVGGRANGQIPVPQASMRRKRSTRRSQSVKKLKAVDLSCLPMARNQDFADCDNDDKNSRSISSKEKLKIMDSMVVAAGFQSYPRRYSKKQNGQTHNQRIPIFGKQLRARERAEKVRSELKFGHPSFVKSMIHSHVSSGFWLSIPTKFCKDHLPNDVLRMVLKDEDGLEHYAKYLGARTCLSGGWKGFALAHNLEVYIIKANNEETNGHFDANLAEEDDGTCRLNAGTKMLGL